MVIIDLENGKSFAKPSSEFSQLNACMSVNTILLLN